MAKLKSVTDSEISKFCHYLFFVSEYKILNSFSFSSFLLNITAANSVQKKKKKKK